MALDRLLEEENAEVVALHASATGPLILTTELSIEALRRYRDMIMSAGRFSNLSEVETAGVLKKLAAHIAAMERTERRRSVPPTSPDVLPIGAMVPMASIDRILATYLRHRHRLKGSCVISGNRYNRPASHIRSSNAAGLQT